MTSRKTHAKTVDLPIPATVRVQAGPALQQRTLLGKYEVVSATRHPNCTIYEAISLEGKRVAIKEICEEYVKGCDINALENFFKTISREAETLQRIDNPNVVKYIEHQHDESNNRFYLVTEWIEGQNLAQVMAADGFEKTKVKEVISSVLDTVGGLGDLVPPVVHRDIKPQNLMICPDGRVVLVDFGFSRSPRGTGTTFLALPINSLGYTAPEIAQGKPGSPRSDLFSIAAVYLHLLTGKNPDDLAKPDGTGHEFPEEVDLPTRAFIEKAMAMDPNDRFASAKEMKAAFEQLDGSRTAIVLHESSFSVKSNEANAVKCAQLRRNIQERKTKLHKLETKKHLCSNNDFIDLALNGASILTVFGAIWGLTSYAWEMRVGNIITGSLALAAELIWSFVSYGTDGEYSRHTVLGDVVSVFAAIGYPFTLISPVITAIRGAYNLLRLDQEEKSLSLLEGPNSKK